MLATVSSFIFGKKASSHQPASSSPQESSSSSSSNPKQLQQQPPLVAHNEQFPTATSLLPRFKSPRNFYFSSSLLSTVLLCKNSLQLASSIKFLRLHLCHHTDFMRKNFVDASSTYYCCGVDDDFVPNTKNQRETFIFEQIIPVLIQKSHLVKTLDSSREFGDFCQCVFDDLLHHRTNAKHNNNTMHKNCKSISLAALRDTLIEILKRKTTNHFEDIHVQSIVDALNQYFIISLAIIGEEENNNLKNATSEFNHTQNLIRVLSQHNHLRDLLCDCVNTIESPNTPHRNHENNNSSSNYLYERQDTESLFTRNNSNDSQLQQLRLPHHHQLHRSSFFSYSSIARLLSTIIQVQILLTNNNNGNPSTKHRHRFGDTSFKSFFGTDYIRDNILVPALQDHQVPDLSETPKLIRKILQTLEYSSFAPDEGKIINNNNHDHVDRGIHEKMKFYALYCSPTSPVQKSLLHVMSYVPCVASHTASNVSFTEKERRNSEENTSRKEVQSKDESQNPSNNHQRAHAHHHHHHHLLSFLHQNIIPICELIETMVLFSKLLANSVKSRDGSNDQNDGDDIDDFLSSNNSNNNESLTETKTLLFNRSPNLVVVVTPHLEHKFSQMATFFLESKMLCTESEVVLKRVLQLIQQERKADKFLKSLVVVHNNNNNHQQRHDLQQTASAKLLPCDLNSATNKTGGQNSNKNNINNRNATSFLVDYKNHKSGIGKLDDNVDEWLTYGKFDDYEDDDSSLQVENSSFSDVVVSSPLSHELESKQKMLSEARRRKEKNKQDKKWFANLAARHSCRGGGIPDDVIEILLEHRIDEHSFLHLDAETLTRTLQIPLGPKLLILDLIKKEKNLIEKASSKNSVESVEKKETAISPLDKNNFVHSPSAHDGGEANNNENNNNSGFSLIDARRSSSVTFDPALVMHELNSRHQSSNMDILEYFRRHSTSAGLNTNFSNNNNNNTMTGAATAAVIINDPYQDPDLTSQARELLTHLHFEVFASSNLVFSPKQIEHEPESQLGKGSNGTVSVAHIIPLGRRSCAAKFIPNIEHGIKEAQNYVNLDHPNITKLYGVTVTNTAMPSIVLLLELGKHNFSLILDAVGASSMLTTDKIRRYAGQLASALCYLHRRKKNKIIINHDGEKNNSGSERSPYSRLLNLDLKPENILVFPGDVLKLVDFGSLQNVSQTMSQRTSVGTTEIYSPPEYFANRIRNEKFEISPAYDVYAFGLILLRMMVSDYLFDSEIRPQLFEMQRKIYASGGASMVVADRPSATSLKSMCPYVIEYFPSRFNEVKDEDLKEICKKCLFVDSKLRPKDGEELLELLQWEDEEEKEKKLLARFSDNHRQGKHDSNNPYNEDVSCPFNANNGNDTSYVQTLQ